MLAAAFKPDKIFQFLEAPGFLADKDNPDSLVRILPRSELARYEARVEGRMKRKMLALRNLFDAGATSVIIADGRVERPLKEAMEGKGTVIQ